MFWGSKEDTRGFYENSKGFTASRLGALALKV